MRWRRYLFITGLALLIICIFKYSLFNNPDIFYIFSSGYFVGCIIGFGLSLTYSILNRDDFIVREFAGIYGWISYLSYFPPIILGISFLALSPYMLAPAGYGVILGSLFVSEGLYPLIKNL